MPPPTPEPDHPSQMTPQYRETPDPRLAKLDEALAEVLAPGGAGALPALARLVTQDPLLAAHAATRHQNAERLREAEILYRLAAPVWPRRHGIALYNNLTLLACVAGRYDEAWGWCRWALAQDPSSGAAMAYDLAKSVHYHGRHDLFWRAINAAQAIQPDSIRTWSARYVEDSFRRVDAEPTPARRPGPAPLPPRTKTPPIRTGARPGTILLVGRDFGNVASFNRLYGPFRHLPDLGYEVSCLSIRNDFDPAQAHMPQFTYHTAPERDLGAISAKLADLSPDVILDLASHGAPETFAAYATRPAPLILGWAGSGISSGTEMFDAFLTDIHLSPRGSESHYTEHVVRLPVTAITVEPYPDYPDRDPGPLPLERNGYATFGAYHRLSKLNEQTLDLWARVLQDIPDSRLVIKTAFVERPATATRLLQHFSARGIDPGRIKTAPMTPAPDHCQTVANTDVTLTPFPEQGLVTDFDHLWMGVPPLALEVDQRPCARLSAALTAAAGAPFLTTRTPTDFIQTARDLVADPDYLRQARRSYRENLTAAGWTDHRRTAAAMAEAIDRLWSSR